MTDPTADARSARRLQLEHLTEIAHEEMFEIPCEQGSMETCLQAAVEAMDRLEAEELEALAERLYEALKGVQIALYSGEDEDDKQIEAALHAWESRHIGQE